MEAATVKLPIVLDTANSHPTADLVFEVYDNGVTIYPDDDRDRKITVDRDSFVRLLKFTER